MRAVLTELVKPGAPPAITGIANGFHVLGTLPGEGETQLFLDTRTGEPVSLTILTAADGSRRWAAAFGEIVDGSAAVPQRNTLAWYRLACGLPRQLPLNKLAGTAPRGSPQGGVGLWCHIGRARRMHAHAQAAGRRIKICFGAPKARRACFSHKSR